MPFVPIDLVKAIDIQSSLYKIIECMGKIEDVLPPQMVPFVEALVCTKVTENSVWLSGNGIAYEYCCNDLVMDAFTRVLSAMCGKNITVYLCRLVEDDRSMSRAERRELK